MHFCQQRGSTISYSTIELFDLKESNCWKKEERKTEIKWRKKGEERKMKNGTINAENKSDDRDNVRGEYYNPKCFS